MRNTKKLLVAALVLLGLTALFADNISNWSGNADGSCTINNQTFYPFAYWSWQWNETQQRINGTWWDEVTGAYGSLSALTQAGTTSDCPVVVYGGSWSIDYPVDIDHAGSFAGCIDTAYTDSCWGKWRGYPMYFSDCSGDWWGNKN